MGLFDSYFDPQTYSGGGGLIDRLLSQLGTQGQYQPSQGFGANPMDANAAVQNAPIAIGDYQMPRIGSGFQQNVEPGQSVLPRQTAQEQAAGQLPAQFQQPAQPSQMQLPPQLQPPGNGLGDRLMAGAQNFAHGGGLIPAVIGGITGLATGQRLDPQGQQQQILQAQYQALRPILGDQKAMLATINPEIGKVLVAQALGPQTLTPLGEGYVADKSGNVRRAYEPSDKTKLVKIGQDGLGREQYGVFNPADGSIKPYSAPGASGSDTGGGLGNMDLTGKDYLASIPTAQRGIVQGIVEGTIAPPSSFALGKPYWQNILQAAKNYDPTFDMTNWSGRVSGVKDFSAGKSSEMVRSANQTLHHVGSLLDSMDALNNGNYPLFNKVGNAVAEATGSGAQGSFRTNAHAVAEELSKVFKGSNLSDAEIHSWEQNLHENMSPEQQRTQIAKLGELLQGSLSALEEKRLNSIGPIAAEKQGPLVKEEGQRVLQRIQDWIRNSGGKSTATPGPLSAGQSTTVGNVTIRRVN